MNKTKKLIISGTIAIIVCYFSYRIIRYERNMYHIEMSNYKPYLWVFNDFAKKDINTKIFVGCVRKRDIMYNYIYKNDYRICIWEFKDLSNSEFKNMNINQNVNLDDIKFDFGEVLNKKSSPEISVNFDHFFKHGININLDKYSKIEKRIESTNYKGFFGKVNKMAFSDETGNNLVLFDYPEGLETNLFLLYKGNDSFYIIIVHSPMPFNEKIINILNLT